MSLERAKADLARARSEVVKLTANLQAATARVTKLEHYLEIARAYDMYDSGASSDRPSPGGLTLVQAAMEIIRESAARQPTRDLIEELERRGYHIGGANKVTNLSSALSRSPALSSSRTKGWGLMEWEQNKAPEAQGAEPERPAPIEWTAPSLCDADE